MGGWVVRVHNARDMSIFHDVPADSLADANQTSPLHRRPGVIVRVVKLDDEPEREAEEIESREPEPARARKVVTQTRRADAPAAPSEEKEPEMANPFHVNQADVDRRVAEKKAAETAAPETPKRTFKQPAPRPCTEPGCDGTYIPIGRRKKCDKCQYPTDKVWAPKREKPTREPDVETRPRPTRRAKATPKPKPSRALVATPRPASSRPASSKAQPVVSKRSASPYDGALEVLRAKRDEQAAVVEKLDEVIAGLEKLAGVA